MGVLSRGLSGSSAAALGAPMQWGGLGPEQNFLRVAYLTCFFSIWKLPSECCLDLECFFPFSPEQCVNPNNLIISVHS
uniref:Secreted protein n=1 Tax=Junco hyemalis TaxID=40217 RepID=A0A8C5ICY9_JUNHY